MLHKNLVTFTFLYRLNFNRSFKSASWDENETSLNKTENIDVVYLNNSQLSPTGTENCQSCTNEVIIWAQYHPLNLKFGS